MRRTATYIPSGTFIVTLWGQQAHVTIFTSALDYTGLCPTTSTPPVWFLVRYLAALPPKEAIGLVPQGPAGERDGGGPKGEPGLGLDSACKAGCEGRCLYCVTLQMLPEQLASISAVVVVIVDMKMT
jgi:hypothetical protein